MGAAVQRRAHRSGRKAAMEITPSVGIETDLSRCLSRVWESGDEARRSN